MRILFTGGVTGGHIMPLISVAEKLPIVAQSRGIPSLEFFYLGVPGMYAQELTSKGITVSRVASVKMRRGAIIRNIIELPLLIVAIIQALWRV
ncbi:MAG: hypothetical protein UY31_C0075G0001, partial [Candidatus Wolfebacteria bacterium GW2011_GWE1_48_7]